ncbi:Plant methyltransferase dimerization [Dillenia turbinata]|uniref:Plant methyltransferase dimerization n=1 Tax=Dillenia turbinata TaxID=194707 RepID=A0AAN8VKP1_9MAGN
MSAVENQVGTSNDHEEEECMLALQLITLSTLPMTLRTAVKLNLFETMAKLTKPGGNQVSAHKLASHIFPAHTPQNPQAADMLDRIMRLLASHSILTCRVVTNPMIGRSERLYGLGPICKYLIPNQDGVSFAPLLLLGHEKEMQATWYTLPEAIIEGGSAFERAHGMQIFEYGIKEGKLGNLFSQAMHDHSVIIMKKILEQYKGFEGLRELVDVGGGLGSTLATIVSKYPNINGINFDLPDVIKDAIPSPGVDHVGGDMFSRVPMGEAIFMKWILHDWSDQDCLKLLTNCYDALPEYGKVIVVESVAPEYPQSDVFSKYLFQIDMGMLCLHPVGKERTWKEFESLARGAGFASSKLICRAYTHWIIEFYKVM